TARLSTLSLHDALPISFEQPEEPKEHLARVAVPRDHGRVQALGDTDLRRGVADRASMGQQRFRERLQRREALLGEHLRPADGERSEEHTSELQSLAYLV